MDIRDAIESAIKTTETEEEHQTTSTEVSAPPPADPPAPATEAAPASEQAPAAPPADAAQAPAQAPVQAPGAAAPAVSPAPPPENPTNRAPGTWTPAAREKWATLPSEVRDEVWRREREASRALTTSTNARRFMSEFEQTIQPFMGFIAAENSTPLQAVHHMMQTAAALRVGTPQQKVQVVADVIRNFGIDLRALDSVLAGQSPEFNPQTLIQQEVQKALGPVQQLQQQLQQRAREQNQLIDQEVDQELDAFMSDPKHEFYHDVKDTMADLMEMALKRGIRLGLTEAYERATLIYEPVRRVIESRKQAEAAKAAAQQVQKARHAAASVTPSSEASVAQPAAGDSIRSAIEFAINAQQGR